ncbi:unnamed protein product, partial [Meganyctiphanes norvegica]
VLDNTLSVVKGKVDEIQQQETNSIVLVSVMGVIGGLIVLSLIGTAVYVFIAKSRMNNKVGLDGPAAHISTKELDSPQHQEYKNTTEKYHLGESQEHNHHNMYFQRGQAAVLRSERTGDPYSNQSARNPTNYIEHSVRTRGGDGYTHQPVRYPSRSFDQSTSSSEPNLHREPRGLRRSNDPFVNQSSMKQPPAVPEKPQGYSR